MTNDRMTKRALRGFDDLLIEDLSIDSSFVIRISSFA